MAYNLYRDGAKIAEGLADKTYRDTGVVPETTYEYRVSEVLHGLESPLSEPLVVTTESEPIPASSISVDMNFTNMVVGETRNIPIVATPEGSSYTIDTVTIDFGTGIVVTDDNRLTAVSTGSVGISVRTTTGLRTTVFLSITDTAPELQSLSFKEQEIEMFVGETRELPLVGRPDNATYVISSVEIQGDPYGRVVTVTDDNRLMAVGEGHAGVNVKTTKGLSAGAEVEVSMVNSAASVMSLFIRPIDEESDGMIFDEESVVQRAMVAPESRLFVTSALSEPDNDWEQPTEPVDEPSPEQPVENEPEQPNEPVDDDPEETTPEQPTEPVDEPSPEQPPAAPEPTPTPQPTPEPTPEQPPVTPTQPTQPSPTDSLPPSTAEKVEDALEKATGISIKPRTNNLTVGAGRQLKVELTSGGLGGLVGGLVGGLGELLTQLLGGTGETIESIVSWTSSDPKIVTVKDGYVNAVAKGKVTITVATANGLKATASVSVT